MVKVIKYGETPRPSEHYQITCTNCKTIFECDSSDCFSKPVAQGFVAHAIRCPVCKRTCFDWQGGCDKWAVVHD